MQTISNMFHILKDKLLIMDIILSMQAVSILNQLVFIQNDINH